MKQKVMNREMQSRQITLGSLCIEWMDFSNG